MLVRKIVGLECCFNSRSKGFIVTIDPIKKKIPKILASFRKICICKTCYGVLIGVTTQFHGL